VQAGGGALRFAMTKAIVIGAGGGIGGALSKALEARGDAVYRLSRRSQPSLDLTDDASIAAAAREVSVKGPFDLILLATGLLHGDGVRPEKSLRDIDGKALDRLFRINATGPALVMRHFLPLLARDRPSVFAALSARVGSIGDNRLGGWVGYRASKAALNQVIRTLSIELARTNPLAVLVGLHPGTVDTILSAPFQRNVDAARLFTAEQAAAHLLAVVAALAPGDSGHCLDWAGERIAP
jgi:NAD(P)-dependent dehydrogenase (short-subunit alcohol dehydrogenase family)